MSHMLCCHGYTHLYRNLICWSISLSVLSTCLNAWLLLCLGHLNRTICVITVCHLAYNARMSVNLSPCPALRLCASLHSQASLAVWATFCHLAEGWSAGGYFMRTRGWLSVTGHECKWQPECNCGMKTQTGNNFRWICEKTWHLGKIRNELEIKKIFFIIELLSFCMQVWWMKK